MTWFQTLDQPFPGIASIQRNGALLAGTQWVEAILRGVYVLACQSSRTLRSIP